MREKGKFKKFQVELEDKSTFFYFLDLLRDVFPLAIALIQRVFFYFDIFTLNLKIFFIRIDLL